MLLVICAAAVALVLVVDRELRKQRIAKGLVFHERDDRRWR